MRMLITSNGHEANGYYSPLIAILLALSRAAAQNPAAPGSEPSEGKKVFTSAGCAKCHDADGSKKLADGTTLLGRLSKVKDPEARLGTRLKDAEQRRHQVFRLSASR